MPSFATAQSSAVRASRDTAPNFYNPPITRLRGEVRRSVETSEYLTGEEQFQPIRRALLSLDNLQANWNSYGAPPPNGRAIHIGWRVFSSLRQAALVPNKALPAAEGGVAFIFIGSNDNRAVIETLNDGEDFVLLYDRQGNSKTLEWSGEIPPDLLACLRAHLKGSRLAAF